MQWKVLYWPNFPYMNFCHSETWSNENKDMQTTVDSWARDWVLVLDAIPVFITVKSHEKHITLSHWHINCCSASSFRLMAKIILQLHTTGITWGESTLITGRFPSQMANNAWNISISWHNVILHLYIWYSHHNSSLTGFSTGHGDGYPISGRLWLSHVQPCFRLMLLVVRDLSQYKDHLSQYGDSHVKDKTVARPSYLWHGDPYTGKMTSLYWIKALGIDRRGLRWVGIVDKWPCYTGTTLCIRN